MDENSEIRNTGVIANNISLQSTGGDITLESIDAGTGFIRIDSAEDILDREGGESTNVAANGLQMTAVGVIGGSDLGNTDIDENSFAINTDVSTLSASSGSGHLRSRSGHTDHRFGDIGGDHFRRRSMC